MCGTMCLPANSATYVLIPEFPTEVENTEDMTQEAVDGDADQRLQEMLKNSKKMKL
jgi:hypothetical protein